MNGAEFKKNHRTWVAFAQPLGCSGKEKISLKIAGDHQNGLNNTYPGIFHSQAKHFRFSSGSTLKIERCRKYLCL